MSSQKSKTLLGMLVVLICAIACDTLPPLPDSVKLGVNPPEVTIPAEGGEATVSFSSPLVWQASSSESWLRITPLTGEAGDITITLSADENTSEEQRSATVTVSIVNYDKSETVKVIQLGKEPVNPPTPELSVSPLQSSFPADGGSASLSVTSNVAWSAEASDQWIVIDPVQGEGDATVTVSVVKNEIEEPRSGAIVFTAGELKVEVAISQDAAEPVLPPEPEEIEGFTATLGDWAAGESVSIGITIEQEIKEVEWAVYLPAEEAAIPMEKGQDGLYRARITGHYPLMPIYFARGGKAVFGSVYTYSYIPWNKDVAEVSLIYTSESSHAVYVDSDRALDVVLDPVSLAANFTAVPPEWKSIGKGKFTDGFVYGLFNLEAVEVEVEMEQDVNEPSSYRILNPYEAFAEDFEYTPENAILEFSIKADNTVYFKESVLGLYDSEYGYFIGMSAVPENGWGYSYYGSFDPETKTAVFQNITVTYLSNRDAYYSSNRNGAMKVVLP